MQLLNLARKMAAADLARQLWESSHRTFSGFSGIKSSKRQQAFPLVTQCPRFSIVLHLVGVRAILIASIASRLNLLRCFQWRRSILVQNLFPAWLRVGDVVGLGLFRILHPGSQTKNAMVLSGASPAGLSDLSISLSKFLTSCRSANAGNSLSIPVWCESCPF